MPAIVLGFATLATIELLAWAARDRDRGRVRAVLLAWLVLQAAIASSGFYTVTDSLPPRLVLAIGPPLAGLVLLFATARGRAFVDALDLRKLTWLHTVRVPVEFVLLWLFQAGLVPQLMTFEGVNFDIVSGITAPVAALVLFPAGRPRRGVLLAWNLACLALVINIAYHGILSVPTPFQQFGFDQPNIGLTRFPFVWLPAVIVPIVLLAHAAAIRQLITGGQQSGR